MGEPKLIASDIDGVTSNTLSLYAKEQINPLLGRVASMQEFRRWEIEDCFKGVISREQVKESWNRFKETKGYSRAKPHKSIVQLYQQLAAEGHQFVYITSRPQDTYLETINWNLRHGLPNPCNVHMTRDKAWKAYCMGVETIIEDNFYNAADVSERIKKTCYVINRPWNLYMSSPVGSEANIRRIGSAGQLRQELEGRL